MDRYGTMSSSASNLVSRMNSKSLQLYLDSEITAFKKSDWIGSLLLQNITLVDGEDREISATGTIDVCQYLPGGHSNRDIDPAVIKLRLDASFFPPSESHEAAFKPSNPTYVRVREELQRSAVQCGYSIIPKSSNRFVCKCARTYARGTSTSGKGNKENEPQQPLRQSSWKYDVKNTRKKDRNPYHGIQLQACQSVPTRRVNLPLTCFTIAMDTIFILNMDVQYTRIILILRQQTIATV